MKLQKLNFKSENLFRTSFVATNLVKSFELNPIRSAIMLWHFGQTRNGSVATQFTQFSSTAKNSATSSAPSEYVAVPKRLGQHEEPARRDEERFSNKPKSAPEKY